VTILRLDDLVGRVSLQPMVTRPTQLFARHRFHSLTALFVVAFAMSVSAIEWLLRLILNVRPTMLPSLASTRTR
jgi:hypothetical protein